jgi:hypothetical protein
MGRDGHRTLMRHFVGPPAVTALTLGMGKASPATMLITPSRRPQGRAPGLLRARRTTVDVASVATAANEHLGTATGAVEQTGGVLHRPLLPMRTGLKTPRWRYLPSGRASHGSGGAVPGRLAGQSGAAPVSTALTIYTKTSLFVISQWDPLTSLPGSTRWRPCSPASMAIDRAIHQLCAEFRRHPQEPTPVQSTTHCSA